MRFSSLALFACALAAAACGSSPIGPSGPLNFSADGASGAFPPTSRVIIGGQTCRVYPTAATIVTTGGAFSSTSNQTCSFNGATQVSCTSQDSDNTGVTSTTTGTADYASVADIVDEVQVVPPLMRALVITSNQVGSNGSSTTTITNSYDGQRRLVQSTAAAAPGSVTTTYTAWDPAGRPTIGTIANPSPIPLSLTIAYDDVARTSTMTSGVFGIQATSVSTYDENGNLVSIVVTGPGQSSTTTVTNLSTGTVCK